MAHSAEEVGREVRIYIAVFVSLLVLTLITVGVSYLHLHSMTERVLVALLVAAAKGSLVALFFMHLKIERPFVFGTLAFTALFVVLVFALPMWTEGDHIVGTRPNKWSAGMEAPKTPVHSPGVEH